MPLTDRNFIMICPSMAACWRIDITQSCETILDLQPDGIDVSPALVFREIRIFVLFNLCYCSARSSSARLIIRRTLWWWRNVYSELLMQPSVAHHRPNNVK